MQYSAEIWGDPYGNTEPISEPVEGDPPPEEGILPTQVDGTWKVAKYFRNHGLAVDTNGFLWATGKNDNGQLGVGSTVDSPYPEWVQVGSGKWIDVAGGDGYSLGIMEDGTLWHWGLYLGVGGATGQETPVQLDSGSWSMVIAAPNIGSVMGIKDDGSLWGWGDNGTGQIGFADGVDRASPEMVDSGPWLTVDISDNVSSMVKADGTLWCAGQTMLGGYFEYSWGLEQVGTDSTWISCATAVNVIFGLMEGGTLWSWGYTGSGSNYGLLGLGEFEDAVYTPTQLLGGDWAEISTSFGYAHALDSSGGLWSWGYSLNGGLAIAGETLKYVPTPADDAGPWDVITAGYEVSIGLKDAGVSEFWTLFKGQSER